MNPIELFHQDGKSAGVFYCATCRNVAPTKSDAERCCAPSRCEGCAAECEKYYTFCPACRRVHEEKRERERFEKAEKVTAWAGPVYSEGQGWNDGYSHNLEDLAEYLVSEGIEPPEYVWVCHERQFVQVDLGNIVDRFADNAFEDWDSDDLSGTKELSAALAAFVEANKDQVSWEPNFKCALILSEQFKAEIQDALLTEKEGA